MRHGVYENSEALYAKWHDLSGSCTYFNEIFNNLNNMHKMEEMILTSYISLSNNIER